MGTPTAVSVFPGQRITGSASASVNSVYQIPVEIDLCYRPWGSGAAGTNFTPIPVLTTLANGAISTANASIAPQVFGLLEIGFCVRYPAGQPAEAYAATINGVAGWVMVTNDSQQQFKPSVTTKTAEVTKK